MRGKVWGAEYRTTLVCMDSYRNRVMQGRFYNPYLKDGQPFESLTQLLIGMEQLLDRMECPAAFTSTRTFSAEMPPLPGPSVIPYEEGVCATFAVRILFRQNASWQGSVVWLDGKQEQNFRSVLELIQLMDSALAIQEKAS